MPTAAAADAAHHRVQALRNDSISARMHAACDGGGSQDDEAAASKEYIVQMPAAAASSKVVKTALEMYEEAGLKQLVMDGLHKQLQRTKDGATEKSRIQELAGRAEQQRRQSTGASRAPAG